jgi:signal recognition particle GTPase
MVLAELGQRISGALASISAAPVIDEAALDACLKEIATALLQADVNVRLVAGLRNNVKKRVNVEQMGQGLNKSKVIEKVRDHCVSLAPRSRLRRATASRLDVRALQQPAAAAAARSAAACPPAGF